MAFALSSSAFAQGKPIPAKYTCDGLDISPPLAWSDAPRGTQSFALIMDDPDAPAGTWVHWVLFNLPAQTHQLAEKAVQGVQGRNSWGRLGYGGPCPPSGTHRYFFRLYALDTLLQLPAGATKEQVLRAMQGHVLAQAELMGV
ncbi:YbhB/YbcL family Raf kinase inhibitor-like protein [Calidithermus roseus]|uniref:Putative lipoprotein LppC n=1 Tax=Calidithermus roseus TaxID=1644118 RepID=A0A399F084_9DEIN|nr:YbhB/YbcL family Raf kinase inhibitor-like protein [Calidithermus roseus]RIH89443.1 putative lipoprotein LppC [Calidithermus roseus]